MIITDDFVYIHYPKTGGTFVTYILEQLYKYKKRYKYLDNLLPKKILNKALRFPEIRNRIQGFIHTNKHGTCNDIPWEHRNKPILSTIRNPYNSLVSHYEFAWWKTHTEEEFGFHTMEEIKNKFSNFPDLNFSEYINLWNCVLLPKKIKSINLKSKKSIGIETFDFIRFFFRNYQEVLGKIDKDYKSYVKHQAYKADMFKVHFIKTDQLNHGLYNFLLDIGWKSKEIAFVLNLKKIFPKEGGRAEDQAWEKYYTHELKSTIRKKERLIFDLFPEFNV